MLDYDTYSAKIGSKYTVAWGELVEAEDGEFEVSKTASKNRIVISDFAKTAQLSAERDLWIGRQWALKKSDCATLAAEYQDKQFNSNYTEIMNSYSLRKGGEYFHRGMVAWLEDVGMPRVALEDRQLHDVVVYDYDGDHNMHIGIYLGDNKLLHHLPNAFSSIDVLDFSETEKFLGVYRHAV